MSLTSNSGSTSSPGVQQPSRPRFGRMDLPLDAVKRGIARSTEWLLGLQHPDGYWCGELEADSMLESDYIFMHTLLGTGDRGKLERAANEILRHQNDDGGWSLYPGGPSNVSYGVERVSCPETDGLRRRAPAHGRGAQQGARAWRRGRVQHLHQNLSVRAWPVRLRRRACGSAGDAAVSELVLLQYLRDQLVVARHPRPAFDHLREKTV